MFPEELGRAIGQLNAQAGLRRLHAAVLTFLVRSFGYHATPRKKLATNLVPYSDASHLLNCKNAGRIQSFFTS